jgi:PIN domain nuclease of toxin-antitoxin system
LGRSQVIVVDTHALLWWKSSPNKLGRKAQSALENAAQVGVAAISCWEIAMLVHKQRLRLDRDVLVWIKQALAHPTTTLLPLLPEIAVQAASLSGPAFGDPADRLIVATAMHFRCPLITKDRTLRALPAFQTIW